MTRDYLSKVPEVTLGFWIIKIVATTLGEVGGNALSMTLNLGYFWSTIAFGVPLIAAVVAQIRAKDFNRFLYWATIALTTLAGTTLADFFDRSLGIGYPGGSLALFALVMATLITWKKSLGSIDIKTVYTPKAEIFYWTAIMFSQTLGTALGDWMADSSGLGYNGSALLIAAVLVAVTLLHFFTKVSRVSLFWAAFILTRPLGATIANSLDKSPAKGGLGINDLILTAVLTILMIVCLFVIPQRAEQRHLSTEPQQA
ncbi:putative membrane-anchored protein [Abditibacterium utsteinense]|uniref:Putative membrane-anchored protein n=1 Tax=Abditibacterium utsteinense TaxID=1960156 RepID=A0A2S8SS74_9BACT|nr:hypothetical protein [Abditibacterium utsteinense]PQV63645.1 putative membrane-anchored protein [Abditibacterium utsteinense]